LPRREEGMRGETTEGMIEMIEGTDMKTVVEIVMTIVETATMIEESVDDRLSKTWRFVSILKGSPPTLTGRTSRI
jgi:hypothetical protein